jgi:hypothetical protein
MKTVTRFHRAILILLVVLAAAGPARAGWRKFNSRHYRIHTDIPSPLAEELVVRLDEMYDEYARRLSGFGAGSAAEPSEVHLFAKKNEFMKFTRDMHPNSTGVFVPGVNRLAAYLDDRASLRRTLQHEGLHQFAFNAISPNLPAWLNEGMAVYFEEGLWTGKSFLIGQVSPDRVNRLQADIRRDRLIPFREMLAMTQADWNTAAAADPERSTTQYNQAWAMVHFLVHGRNGDEPYRPRLLKMLKLHHDGRRADDAFNEAFSPNIDGFQSRFTEFALKLQPTEEATMLQRQEILAQMIILLQARDMRFDDIDELREFVTRVSYRLRYRKGNDNFETAADPIVYFQDPSGELLPRDRLFFWRRPDAPVDDLVCRWKDDIQFRTRFFYAGDAIEHDIAPEGR